MNFMPSVTARVKRRKPKRKSADVDCAFRFFMVMGLG